LEEKPNLPANHEPKRRGAPMKDAERERDSQIAFFVREKTEGHYPPINLSSRLHRKRMKSLVGVGGKRMFLVIRL